MLFPKGEPRPTTKRREARVERKIISLVRLQCVDRDGYCRLYYLDAQTRTQVWAMFGSCQGPSQWSHFNETHRRSKTMRQSPELRHDRRFSLMLCAFHAAAYDQNRMIIEGITDNCCDGLLRYIRDGRMWEEVP